jgi:hypothetical protein
MIGTGAAGGVDEQGATHPSLHLFGTSPAIDRGFVVVPEPSALSMLVCICVAAIGRVVKTRRAPAEQLQGL